MASNDRQLRHEAVINSRRATALENLEKIFSEVNDLVLSWNGKRASELRHEMRYHMATLDSETKSLIQIEPDTIRKQGYLDWIQSFRAAYDMHFDKIQDRPGLERSLGQLNDVTVTLSQPGSAPGVQPKAVKFPKSGNTCSTSTPNDHTGSRRSNTQAPTLSPYFMMEQNHHPVREHPSRSAEGQGRDGKLEYDKRMASFRRWVRQAVETASDVNSTVNELESSIDDVKAALKELENASMKVSLDVQDDLEWAFNERSAVLREIKNKIKTISTGITENSDASRENSSVMFKSAVHLEKMPVPKWDGEIRSYINFKPKFKIVVESQLAPEFALMRLKDVAIDEKSRAHQLIRARSSLDEVWEVLDMNFADPRLVRDTILRDLRSVAPVRIITDAAGLRRIANTVISARDDLKSVNLEYILGESAMGELMTKIPHQIRTPIDDRTADRTKPPLTSEEYVKMFIDTLDKHAYMQEAHVLRTEAYSKSTEVTSPSPPNVSRSNPRSNHAQSRSGFSSGGGQRGLSSHFAGSGRSPRPAGSGQSRSSGNHPQTSRPGPHSHENGGSRVDPKASKSKYCAFHPDSPPTHTTLECKKAQSMPVIEVRKYLHDTDHCIRCFLAGHKAATCNSSITCPEVACTDPSGHSKFTHIFKMPPVPATDPAPPDGNVSSSIASALSGDSVVSSDKLSSQPRNAKEKDELDTQLGLNTIRPCHYAYVKNNKGTLMKVSIMYDSGCDMSQVCNGVVLSTGIQPVNTLPELLMKVAGSQDATSFGQSELLILPVYDQFGILVLNLKCISVDYIGHTNPGKYDEVASKFAPKHDLSELLEPAAGDISILIGCNYANLHPTPVSTKGTVVFAECKFGKLMYGSDPSFPKQSYIQRIPSQYFETVVSITDYTLQLATARRQLDRESITASSRSEASLKNLVSSVAKPPKLRTATEEVENLITTQVGRSDGYCSPDQWNDEISTQRHDSDDIIIQSPHESELSMLSDKTVEAVSDSLSNTGEQIPSGGAVELISVDTTQGKQLDGFILEGSSTRSGILYCDDGSRYVSSMAMSITPAEQDQFDQMVAIDDQVSCFRCGTCPPDYIPRDREEARLREVYRDCITYDPINKRFRTRMPWIADFRDLPDNRSAVEKRLFSLTKSMSKTPEMRERYCGEFYKMIEAGVLEEVTQEEANEWLATGGKVFYVSHFPHFNESSLTTPLRVIFDPTISYKGVLISRLWENCPKMTPDLPRLLLNFREGKIPICLDISKAYWSVYLDLIESHLHRVLWNDLDPSKPPKIYRMTRNSWGMKPAGSICSLAMVMLAEMYKDSYPDVYNFVKNQMYVDDGCYSVNSVESAMKLARDTCWVMSQGNFHVKHFIIGNKNVDVTTGESADIEVPDIVRFGGDTERILGVQWWPKSDSLGFICRVNFSKRHRGAKTGPDVPEESFDLDFPEHFSLRMYLSQVASLFDPLGLASGATIAMKHELGRIFQLEGGWDAPIPHITDDSTANHQRCKEIIRTFYGVAKIQFQRCLRPVSTTKDASPTLVIFCDASSTAYGAMAYYNWPTTTGPRASTLICAKAKPVPKKEHLLRETPRGELCAVVVGIRILKFITENTSYEIERIFILTDSTIVLSQISNSPNKFKPWVAARLDEVRRSCNINDFAHVSSEDNAADDISRSLDPSMMGIHSAYQNGRKFMSLPIDQWPIKPITSVAVKVGEEKEVDSLMEVRSKDPRMIAKVTPSVNLVTSKRVSVAPCDVVESRTMAMLKYLCRLNVPIPDINEDWLRLRRKIARVIHFAENVGSLLRCRDDISESVKMPKDFSKFCRREQREWIQSNDRFAPTFDEMELAKLFLIKMAQSSITYNVEKHLKSLNPVIDENGLWRVLGRSYTIDTAPYFIPYEHPLASIIVNYFHCETHCGGQSTLARLRRYFWITKGSLLANVIVKECARCRLLRKRSIQVAMAPLRPHRLAQSQVFEVVSLDLCGPYLTKAERRNTRSNPALAGKVWILVIVCSASSAIQLELVEGYDTSNFLVALDNFVHLRGQPKKYICDRGSQIVSASDTVESLWEVIDDVEVRNHVCQYSEFEFVPSGAHSFLGHAERMVRSFKEALETITHSKAPLMTKIEFSRQLTAIASIVNSRPLAVGNVHVAKLDDCLISPNDLLLGRCTSEISPVVEVDNSYENLPAKRREYLKLLRQKQVSLNNFWTKWQKVVFTTLMQRPKWHKSDKPLAVGDIVLIRDTNPVRGKWTWGEVINTPKSIDGLTRQAAVRYKSPVVNAKGDTKSKSVTKSVRDLVLLLGNDER